MAENLTWLKLYRSLLEWEWYTDSKTKDVFLHLLLKANIKTAKFRGITVHRGQLITSHQSIAQELGMSVRSVRTAINHLKSTGEVTSHPYHDFSLISIQNFDRFQGELTSQVTSKRQATDKPSTSQRQQSKNNKECKKEEKSIAPPAPVEPREWERDIPERFKGRFDDRAAWEDFLNKS